MAVTNIYIGTGYSTPSIIYDTAKLQLHPVFSIQKTKSDPQGASENEIKQRTNNGGTDTHLIHTFTQIKH